MSYDAETHQLSAGHSPIDSLLKLWNTIFISQWTHDIFLTSKMSWHVEILKRLRFRMSTG